jgi:hypothetical protein
MGLFWKNFQFIPKKKKLYKIIMANFPSFHIIHKGPLNPLHPSAFLCAKRDASRREENSQVDQITPPSIFPFAMLAHLSSISATNRPNIE